MPAVGHRRRGDDPHRHLGCRGDAPRAHPVGAPHYRDRHARDPAPHLGGGRVRPRARRGHRARRRDPAVGRAGRRQVDTAARSRRPHRGRGRPGALRQRRRVARPGAPACRAHRRPARRALPRERDRPRHDPRPRRPDAARASHRRLGADRLVGPDRRRGRSAEPGARSGIHPHPRRERPRTAGDPRGARHERRSGRRPPHSGAPGRRRLPLRGRPADVTAVRARAEEPIRRDR